MISQVPDFWPVVLVIGGSVVFMAVYALFRRPWSRWATAAVMLGLGSPLALDAVAVRPSWPAYLGAAMVGLGLVVLAYASREHRPP